MSYTHERDQFVATITREGLPLHVADVLLRTATTLQRLAELACSSEAADRDRIPCPAATWKPIRFRGETRTDRTTPQKPYGPCLCDDYPVGSHAAGEHQTIPRITLQDYRAEQRAIKAIEAANKDLARRPSGMVAEGIGSWSVLTQGDPRGYVLRIIPPSYADRNADRDVHNLESIGVPARDSRLRF